MNTDKMWFSKWLTENGLSVIYRYHWRHAARVVYNSQCMQLTQINVQNTDTVFKCSKRKTLMHDVEMDLAGWIEWLE